MIADGVAFWLVWGCGVAAGYAIARRAAIGRWIENHLLPEDPRPDPLPALRAVHERVPANNHAPRPMGLR